MATHIVVMGYGQIGRELNRQTASRIGCAILRLLELESWGVSVASLIFTSGSGRGDVPKTLSMQMEEFMQLFLEQQDITLPKVTRVVINRSSHEVWGTIREMEWAYEKAKEIDTHPRLEFSTNVRHGVRVRLTNRLVTKIPNIGIIESSPLSDPPSILRHEFLAYTKLFLCALGAQKVLSHVERFRRKHYSAG